MGKKLGQHFLHSPAVLNDILAAAKPKAGEPVLEIGPGEGALTERLLETGITLRAVELDANLAGKLRGRWGESEEFRLIDGDALKIPLSPLELFGNPAPYAVIANLPYYLSTPLLFRLAGCRRAVRSARSSPFLGRTARSHSLRNCGSASALRLRAGKYRSSHFRARSLAWRIRPVGVMLTRLRSVSSRESVER